jgi:excisionase family DNA binding protein
MQTPTTETTAELTIAQAATYAGVSDRTIRNWVGDHWVRARATEGGRLIPQADLDRVVAARRAGQVPGPLPPPALVPVGATNGPGLGTPDAEAGPATASAGDGAGRYALAVLEVAAGGLVAALARRDDEVAQLREALARANATGRDQAETIGMLRAELRGRTDQVLVLAAMVAEPPPVPALATGVVARPWLWRWWAAHRPASWSASVPAHSENS